ncbi:MAG: FUSC family protein [Legionella longbeachae]|nr:FUSC family protein [Legionella longbeachae]
MHYLLNHCKWIKNEIRGQFLLRGILVLMPFAFLFLLSGNIYWLESSLITMSTLIAEEKLKLGFLGILLHGTAIIILFNLLFLTQVHPFFFVLVCTISATGIIWISTFGEQLRNLGSWTFIPAIILSLERAPIANISLLDQCLILLPFLIIAILPTIFLCLFEYIKAKKNGLDLKWFQLSYLSDFGKKNKNYDSLLAMAIGIALSSTFVEYIQMENGQWMIWGVASVITGNIQTSPKKFYERLFGVSIGVPMGILMGNYVMPSTELDLTIATMGIFLTLVAFRRYIIAYTFRCFFVALAVILVTHSKIIAFERLTHVILGGVLGIICVLLSRRFVDYIFNKNENL